MSITFSLRDVPHEMDHCKHGTTSSLFILKTTSKEKRTDWGSLKSLLFIDCVFVVLLDNVHTRLVLQLDGAPLVSNRPLRGWQENTVVPKNSYHRCRHCGVFFFYPVISWEWFIFVIKHLFCHTDENGGKVFLPFCLATGVLTVEVHISMPSFVVTMRKLEKNPV